MSDFNLMMDTYSHFRRVTIALDRLEAFARSASKKGLPIAAIASREIEEAKDSLQWMRDTIDKFNRE